MANIKCKNNSPIYEARAPQNRRQIETLLEDELLCGEKVTRAILFLYDLMDEDGKAELLRYAESKLLEKRS